MDLHRKELRAMSLFISSIIWVIFSLLPNWFTLPRWEPFIPPDGRFIAVCGLVLIMFSEVVVFILVGMVFKFCFIRTKNTLLYIPVTGLFLSWLLLTSLYLCSLCVSWYLMIHNHIFIDQNMLNALVSNPIELFRWTPDHTIRYLIAVLILNVCVISICYKFLNSFKPTFLTIALVPLAIVSTFLANQLINLPLAIATSADEREMFVNHIKATLDPRLNLGWSNLIFPNEGLQYKKLANLEPQTSSSKIISQVDDRSRKNVVVLIVEALRRDILKKIGGDPTIAPNLNRLAAEGILFENCITQAPESVPSKIAILTGLYPIFGPYRDTFTNDQYPITRIYDVLNDNNFLTASFNSTKDAWQNVIRITYKPFLDQFYEAFDYSKPIEGFSGSLDEMALIKLTEWMTSRKASGKRLYAHFQSVSTHFPFYQEFSGEKLFVPFQMPAEVKSLSFEKYDLQYAGLMKNRYLNTVHYFDKLIGDFLKRLEVAGVLKDTVLVITGDHGELFGEHGFVNHGGPLYQEAINVPLLVWGANEKFIGSDLKAPVAHIDIAPTILELMDIPTHPNFQGLSLLRADKSTNRYIFSSSQGLSNQISVVHWPWKLIVDYQNFRRELFNLATDAKEQNNLINVEEKIASVLLEKITDFRSSQFSFYQSADEYYKKYYQPKYNFDADFINLDITK